MGKEIKSIKNQESKAKKINFAMELPSKPLKPKAETTVAKPKK